MTDPPQFLLTEDVATMLGLAKSTVSEHARRGLIPCFKAPGTRRVLFRMDELDAWTKGAALVRRELGNGGYHTTTGKR